jgi:hypothetical protein
MLGIVVNSSLTGFRFVVEIPGIPMTPTTEPIILCKDNFESLNIGGRDSCHFVLLSAGLLFTVLTVYYRSQFMSILTNKKGSLGSL